MEKAFVKIDVSPDCEANQVRRISPSTLPAPSPSTLPALLRTLRSPHSAPWLYCGRAPHATAPAQVAPLIRPRKEDNSIYVAHKTSAQVFRREMARAQPCPFTVPPPSHPPPAAPSTATFTAIPTPPPTPLLHRHPHRHTCVHRAHAVALLCGHGRKHRRREVPRWLQRARSPHARGRRVHASTHATRAPEPRGQSCSSRERLERSAPRQSPHMAAGRGRITGGDIGRGASASLQLPHRGRTGGGVAKTG